MERRKTRIALVSDYFTSDYSKTLISGLQQGCQENNADLFIFPIGEINNLVNPYDYQNLAITSLITKQNIDGVVFESGSQLHFISKSELSSYVKSYKPVPIVSIAADLYEVSSICVTSRKAYEELLTDLVVNQGCKKFGIITTKTNSPDIKERSDAINSTLEKLNVSKDEIVYFEGNFNYGVTFGELEKYYQRENNFDFDALVAVTDEMAYAAIDFCRNIEKRIPDDVVICGFDDLEGSVYTNPPLTTINQNIFEQGRTAVKLLIDSINGTEMPERTLIEAKTIVRNSSLRNSSLDYRVDTDVLKYVNQNKSFGKEYSHAEWFKKKNQFYQVTKFYTDMQYDMNMTNLQKRINEDLKHFGVTACAIVIYDKPIEMATPFEYFNLPRNAFVFSAYDYATNVDYFGQPEVIKFNPNNTMIPENLVNFDSQGMYVIPVFHNTIQYGYMLFRPGEYEISIYDLLCKIVSTIISSVYSFELLDDERVKNEIAKRHLDIVASTDELTGLKNRRGLYDNGELVLKFAKARNHHGVVLYCDIDGLKKINDVHGHEAGDKAIIAESIILKGNFRNDDIIARIGGDEFVIIAPGLNAEQFERIRERILDDCALWTDSNNAPFQLSISMGCIEYPSDECGYKLPELLSQADKVLYQEKKRKKEFKQ